MEYLPMDFGGEAYLHDMFIAQEFAHLNRIVMGEKIIRFLGATVQREVFSVHNYISEQDHIIRKGAISARTGEDLVIPFNMRDGLIIAKGKGNKNWNFSAPHGAGRLMSRTQARKDVKLEEFKDSMQGVYSTCIGEGTLDESPMVYKAKDEIIKNIADTVEVELFVKPIYNFKAQGDDA